MKNFRRFNPGDPVAASRLNDLIDYAGVAQSSVPNTPGTYFGSQRTNGESSYDSNLNFLVYATEDFAVRTTDHATVDDVPSGLCDFVDLIRASNTHVPQEGGRKFYVHDPIAGMTGTASKSENDVFHIVFNRQSKRWEVLSGGGGGISGNLLHGIIVKVHGCGYYDVEFSNWAGQTPSEDSVSASVDTDECEICDNLIEGAGGVCENDKTLPEFTETDPTHRIVTRQTERNAVEDRVVVLGFNRISIFVPLALWSECLLQDIGDTNPKLGSSSRSESGSGSGSDDTEPVYQIVDGFQEHTIQYIERWECCNGQDMLMGRKAKIWACHTCPEEVCNECE